MSSPTKSNVFTKLIPIKRTAPSSLRNTGIFRRKNRQTKQITTVCHSLALGKHSGLFLPFADCWHEHSYSSWPRHNEICSSWHTALPDTVWLPEVIPPPLHCFPVKPQAHYSAVCRDTFWPLLITIPLFMHSSPQLSINSWRTSHHWWNYPANPTAWDLKESFSSSWGIKGKCLCNPPHALQHQTTGCPLPLTWHRLTSSQSPFTKGMLWSHQSMLQHRWRF